MAKSYKELLQNINTFILDVDGVLTDGRLIISENGALLRTMNVRDGYAMKTALDNGYNVCIITGGTNEGVKMRLTELGIKDIYLNASNKMTHIRKYVAAHNLKPENIVFMGDDMPDVQAIQYAGLGCCPQDAIPEAKAVSQYISHKNGGDACVRDIIEQVMKVHGKWKVQDGESVKST